MTDTARSGAVYPEGTASAAAGPGVGQRAWWLAVGLLATIGEQTTRVAEALVEKGRRVEPGMMGRAKQAASGVSGVAEGAAARVRRAAAGLTDVRVPRASRGSGGPTAEEFAALVEEVRELKSRVGAHPGERIPD